MERSNVKNPENDVADENSDLKRAFHKMILSKID